MTEIVDERQRLVDRYTAALNLIVGQAGIPDATEACRQIIRTAQSALASRPQEQPRKATEEPVAYRVKDYADGWILYANNARALREAERMGVLMEPLYLSVSPAAAQGWQTIETARKLLDETLHWIPDYASVRYRIVLWLAAAPPSPQEQEK